MASSGSGLSSPYEYIELTGTIIPDTSDILTTVQAEYISVFGADLILTPGTPQGLLMTAEALARAEVVQNNAALANQINPNIAGGVFLDAILALTGMQRTAASQTVVTGVTVTGVAGTLVPGGSQAQTSVGDLFQSSGDVTLDDSGNGTINFIALNFGPVPCAANSLTGIVSNVLGWETVNNTNSGVLGQATQSDQQARALRLNTLAFQGVSLAEAITSALYETTGVTSLTFQENVLPTTEVINEISMIGHSIYVCVAGGADTDVAAALLENKSSGCAWNGSTSISVVEPASGQSYVVKFDRPTAVPVLVRVTTPNGNENDIIQSVLDYANGLISGLIGFTVGNDVLPFEISAAILTENIGTTIEKVEVTLDSDPTGWSTDIIAIGVNQQASIDVSSISFIIG